VSAPHSVIGRRSAQPLGRLSCVFPRIGGDRGCCLAGPLAECSRIPQRRAEPCAVFQSHGSALSPRIPVLLQWQ
jgi:hypothetical protein